MARPPQNLPLSRKALLSKPLPGSETATDRSLSAPLEPAKALHEQATLPSFVETRLPVAAKPKPVVSTTSSTPTSTLASKPRLRLKPTYASSFLQAAPPIREMGPTLEITQPAKATLANIPHETPPARHAHTPIEPQEIASNSTTPLSTPDTPLHRNTSLPAIETLDTSLKPTLKHPTHKNSPPEKLSLADPLYAAAQTQKHIDPEKPTMFQILLSRLRPSSTKTDKTIPAPHARMPLVRPAPTQRLPRKDTEASHLLPLARTQPKSQNTPQPELPGQSPLPQARTTLQPHSGPTHQPARFIKAIIDPQSALPSASPPPLFQENDRATSNAVKPRFSHHQLLGKCVAFEDGSRATITEVTLTHLKLEGEDFAFWLERKDLPGST